LREVSVKTRAAIRETIRPVNPFVSAVHEVMTLCLAVYFLSIISTAMLLVDSSRQTASRRLLRVQAQGYLHKMQTYRTGLVQFAGHLDWCVVRAEARRAPEPPCDCGWEDFVVELNARELA